MYLPIFGIYNACIQTHCVVLAYLISAWEHLIPYGKDLVVVQESVVFVPMCKVVHKQVN